MNKKLSVINHSLATLAGLCFVSGLAILADK